jgi:tetratricopeptide (TPR) repeat protein
VGKLLPKGELHDTHDLVQNWNKDPHVTSLRHRSYTAFCADCHSPYDGSFAESGDDEQRRVFAESKQNITCIGCHNPHELSNAAYVPGLAALQPALPVRPTTYAGNDADFTTTDHREWSDTSEACLQCHRGADRVDLDHANASCIDCHNTFNRNHTPESRQFHDSNQPQLSCRGCHDNATHLMSILYQDPDFLDPKHIHNLRTLPARVRTRYKLIYPGLRAGHTVAVIPGVKPTAPEPDAPRAITTPDLPRATELQALLSRGDHLRMAENTRVQPLRDALLNAPRSTIGHVQLAQAYAEIGEFFASRELLQQAFSLDSSRLLLELPLASDRAQDSGNQVPPDTYSAQARALLPDSLTPTELPLFSWLQVWLAMRDGQFVTAEHIIDATPSGTISGLYRALADLGQGEYRRGRTRLEAYVEAHPENHTSRAALGYLHLAARRTAAAIPPLKQAVLLAPTEGAARLLLGHAHLRNDDPQAAIEAYRGAIAVEPALVEAQFALARAYQSTGRPDVAMEIYRAITQSRPGLFEARIALANSLKLQSDRISFQMASDRESNPPPGTGIGQWKASLSAWEQQRDEYQNLALVELAAAIQIRPAALDAYRQVAEIYRRSGRLEEAERFYQWLARRQPQLWMHDYRLGTIQIAQERYSRAAETLRRVIARAPTDGDSYIALGLALVRAGHLQEAVSTFEQATHYEPYNPALYTNLGAAYAYLGDLEQAQSALERSLQLHSFPLPRVHLTETNLALVHLRAGRREEAAIALRRALHQYAGYPLAQELLEHLMKKPETPGEAWPPAIYNSWLERFGEVTSVGLASE